MFLPNFQHDLKFLDFAHFHPSQVPCVLNFTKFHPSHVPSGQKCMFFAKFSSKLEISEFWLIFILRRSCVVKNLLFFSQIFNTTQNFWILSNFILCRFWVAETKYKVRSIKMLKFKRKRGDRSNGMLKFEDNVKNRSKCWNLSAKCQADQNDEIWVKRGDWSKCPNLSERGNRWKHWNLKTSWESIKMLKFEC